MAERGRARDIEAWLQGLGLVYYVPASRDDKIDWEALPKLTSEDLQEIGIAAIGHRRRLLDAIAALGASATTAAHLPSASVHRRLPMPSGYSSRLCPAT